MGPTDSAPLRVLYPFPRVRRRDRVHTRRQGRAEWAALPCPEKDEGGMFEVVRVRLAVAEDGAVLAMLGAEVRGPGGQKVELRRDSLRPETWGAGIWLRPGDLD